MNDYISRESVLNTIEDMDKALDTDRTVEEYKALLIECVKALPSKDFTEELEKIKEEIKDLDLGFFDEDYRAGVARGIMEFNKILNNHISDLKG